MTVDQENHANGRIPGTFSRLVKYISVKIITLMLTVTVGLYLTIMIINLGGYVDEMIKGEINESIGAMILGGWLKDVTDQAEREKTINETREAMFKARGLNESFPLRTARWLWSSLKLDLGQAYVNLWTNDLTGQVREIVLSRLPFTLALVGLANIFVFFSSIFFSLFMTHRHGSRIDRVITTLSPLTSAPSWIIGIILIMIFAWQLHWLPYPKPFQFEGANRTLPGMISILRHMIMPVMAVVLAAFFTSVYTWRTFFLIYSEEDYVQIARAKGLSARAIDRRYILRPVLPYLLTSFATMMILLWQGAIALETLFMWPGIGSLFLRSIKGFNTPVTLGVVVVFAYLLAITVLLLDVIYAIVDPRVRLGGEGSSVRMVKTRRRFHLMNNKKFPIAKNIHPDQSGVMEVNSQSIQSDDQLPPDGDSHKHKKRASGTHSTWKELKRYPSTMVGLIVIGCLIVIALVTMIVIPYREVVAQWRGSEGDMYRTNWYKNPQYAAPAWINLFRRDNLPKTILLNSQKDDVNERREPFGKNMEVIKMTFPIDYPYRSLPQDVVLFITTTLAKKPPLFTFTWRTPDGREIDLGSQSIKSNTTYYLSRDKRLMQKLKTESVLESLFTKNENGVTVPVAGKYQLEVAAYIFDPATELTAELIVYGKVAGLAGTDNLRRSLTLGLLWGLPVALTFGILGAICTTLLAMFIAATGVWFGGWVDDLIQRLTDLNMIIPVFPIAILVYYLYSKSIWVVLGVLVFFSIFSSTVKNYRSVFLQIKKAPYIEAAQISGASSWRIIRKYLTPAIMPVVVPQMVIMIPVFVFYEATLAYLGVIDPYLPTWGKIIYDALSSGTLERYPYWFMEPVALLMITSLAFALLGFGLETVLNPRLRRD